MANIPEEALLALAVKNKGGGGGGTTNYNDLSNQPQIEGHTLTGNKSASDLGLATEDAVEGILDGQEIDSFSDVETALADKVDKVNGKGLSTNDYDDTEKGKNADNATAIAGMLDGAEIDSFADVETALAGKQDTLTFDNAPTENSNNPVKSGGIYTALADKVDKVNGKGLSTNDYDDTEKAQVATNADDISTLKSGLTTLDDEVNGDETNYDFADVVTIEDAVPANLADCKVKVEPVQDLHGYDKPWVGGSNTNKYDDSTKLENKMLLSGGNYYDNSWFDMSDYIDVTGNDGYVTMSWDSTLAWYQVQLCAYDSSKQFISDSYINYENSNTKTHAFVVPNNAKYVRFSWAKQTSGGSVGQTNIRVNLGNTDLGYAPFENICPITGHTEASVQRDGNDVWTGNDSYTIASAGHVIPNTTIALPVGTYALDFEASNPSGAFEFEVFKGNSVDWANRLVDKVFTAKARNIVKFTLTETSTNLRLYSTAGASISNVRLFSTVQTYTIALGDTIYGGTVDFDSGVMTVTQAVVDMDTLEWTRYSTNLFVAEVSGKKPAQSTATKDNLLCSCYDTRSTDDVMFNDADSSIGGASSNNKVFAHDNRYDNATDLITALNGQTLCYELATPTTIQLTPQQIQLLKGQNTLYASTGDISVTVNGVSGSIGAVQEQVNELAEEVAEIKPVNYSTTEQKTGQKWIDGKDIYFCTFTGLTITTTSNWQDTGIDSSNMDTIIGGLAIDDSKQSIVCSFGFGTNPTVILRAYMSTNVIKSVTLYYTKTT